MSLDLVVKDAVREVVREEIRAAFAEFQAANPSAPPAPAPEAMMDVADVVAFCGDHVTAPTVRAWCKSGRLVSKKLGKSYLIAPAALQRFLSTLHSVDRAAPDPEEEASRMLSKLRGK